jgi:hypothetical protein
MNRWRAAYIAWFLDCGYFIYAIGIRGWAFILIAMISICALFWFLLSRIDRVVCEGCACHRCEEVE